MTSERGCLTVFTVAGEEPDQAGQQAAIQALTDASYRTLDSYAQLSDSYDRTIAQGEHLIDDVDETLRKVQAILEDLPD